MRKRGKVGETGRGEKVVRGRDLLERRKGGESGWEGSQLIVRDDCKRSEISF